MTDYQPLTLTGFGLLSKWGFSDGDAVRYYLRDRDLSPSPEIAPEGGPHGAHHVALIRLVREHLLPAIERKIGEVPEVYEICTIHNPIRFRDQHTPHAARIEEVEVEIPFETVLQAAGISEDTP